MANNPGRDNEKANTPPVRSPIAAMMRAKGDLLFLSGQIAVDERGVVQFPDDVSAQTELVLSRISELLGTEGAALTDVVKLTTYFTDVEDLNGIRSVRARFFPEGVPAATTVRVAGLARPGLRIEIEAVAAVPGD
jgi:enamine deaminase RidA (YjgF/YER057c/UK114 family)